MAKRRKRRLSRRQLAALAKGRAALKKLRNPKRRHRRHGRRKHRNPSGIGEILTMSNPRRRRRHHGRRHRRHSRRSRGLALFSNPGGAVLAAAASGPKEMIKGDFLKDVAAVTVGFIAPNQILMHLPAAMVNAPWKAYASKVGIFVALSAVGKKVGGPRAARMVLLGGALGLAVDLYTDYVEPMLTKATTTTMTPAPASGAAAYYGKQRLQAYYGRPSRGMGQLTSAASAFEREEESGY